MHAFQLEMSVFEPHPGAAIGPFTSHFIHFSKFHFPYLQNGTTNGT